MVNAASDSVRLQYAPEATYGTQNSGATPSTARFTSEGFERLDSSLDSAEINGDRTSRPGVVVDESAAGPLNCEWSCTTFDEWVKAAMMGADFGSTLTYTASTISFVAGDATLPTSCNCILDSANGFTNFATGQMIEVTAANTAANKQIYKIALKLTNGKMFLEGNFVTTDAAAATTVVGWRNTANGTTQWPWSIEREHRDLATTFIKYTGGLINSLSLSARAQQFITGTLNWIFKKEDRAATATGFAGSPSAATTTPALAAGASVLAVWEGGPSAEALAISSTTDATPIVVTTTTEHNLNTGDIVGQINHNTNGNANGVFSILRLSSTTYALRDRVTLASIVGSGAGAGGATGSVKKLSSAVCFTGLDFSINNNYAEQFCISSTTCGKAVAAGSLDVTGTLSFYLDAISKRLLDKIADQARTSLTIIIKDTDGNRQAFDFPDVELKSQSGTGASGKNNPIAPTIAWRAVRHAGELVQCRFSKP